MAKHSLIERGNEIVEHLKANLGKNFHCRDFVEKFGWKSSPTSRLLIGLAREGRIMTVLTSSDREYWIPDPTTAASAAPSHTAVDTKPLKVDRHRIELYRQLAADRAAIPSIG